MPDAAVRAFALRDLPLVQRLKSHGISLDSEEYLSRGLHTLGDATLARLSLHNLGTPTVVVHDGAAQAFGQLRLKPNTASAHIIFVAPGLCEEDSARQQTLWLHVLDALSAEAGERGAARIHAEVDENSTVFAALRQAGFASYARQDIWRRDPDPLPAGPDPVASFYRADRHDMPLVHFLYARTVPRLIQQADPAPRPGGLVYVQDGKALCYLSLSTGERGVYIRPYMHIDDSARVLGLFRAALHLLKQPSRVPVYCCVRQYQRWMSSSLEALGFTPWARQTVMVKRTTAHIKHPAFAPLSAVNGIPISGGSPGS